MSGEGVLDGRVAVVTGGGGGIGRATCTALAACGAAVVVADRCDAGAATVADLDGRGVPALGLSVDVRSPHDLDAMVERILDRFGRIDVLVAAAGILRTGPPSTVAGLPVEEWDTIIGTNLRGTFLSNRAVLPTMLRQHSGTIVNLSSTSGRRGLAYDAAYCASKFGVIGLTESLAEEVGPHGVKVHVVLPGPVDTPLWDQNGPLPRPVTILAPQRVADLVTFLVCLPEDTMIVQPTVVGFRSRRRAGSPSRGTGNGAQVLGEVHHR